MKKVFWILTCVAILCPAAGISSDRIMASSTPVPSTMPKAFPRIDRRPPPMNFNRGALDSIPVYDPDSQDAFQMDFRSHDLSSLDLRGSLKDLLYADFDDRTRWPSRDRMPKEYDPKRIMELGKNPGLGVRHLHERGITGRGVSIAIIDQPLLTGHQEYASRLRLYEEIHVTSATVAQMHGPAVASIAVGKTLGVAPEASLYYIASTTGDYGPDGKFTRNFRYFAQAIRRILEINRQLPENQRIRVISISVGWSSRQSGYDDIMTAVEEAKTAGVFIVSSSLEETWGFKFHGLGRTPMADPDTFESYEPGMWWAKKFHSGTKYPDCLFVPMDSRTTASPSADNEYVFYRSGGWSWSIPYIAGVYALAVQVKPSITPKEFWDLALKTGHSIEVKHQDRSLPMGPIVDPAALVKALQGK